MDIRDHLANHVYRTTIMGYNFSAPFFIAPAAKAGLANADAESGLIKGAAAGNILYIVSSGCD